MDEDLTGRTGELLAGLALFRDASVPPPSPELAALFAATATTTTSALPTRRSIPVYKRLFAGVPSKIAAAALGALLAGGLGAGAGALTGTMTLASHEDDAPAVETPAVDDATVVADDDAEHESDEVEDEVAVDEADDDGANDAAADADLAAVPVPTSVSEAAHTHDFDEACGNHGHYVSFFARTGTELECAVEARAAAADALVPGDDVDGAEVVGDEVSSDDDAGKHDAKDEDKAEKRSAKAEAKATRSAAGASSKSNKGKGGR